MQTLEETLVKYYNSLIEKGNISDIKNYLIENITPYKDKVQNVVLGCTHYPLIENELKEILGNVNFFNGAPNLAKHLKEILEKENLLNDCELNIEFIDSQNSEEKKTRFFNILKEE